MGIVLAILIFLLVVSVSYLVYLTIDEKNQAVRERLKRLSSPGEEYSQWEQVLSAPVYVRLFKPALAKVAQLAARLTPKEHKEKLRSRLLMAGNPGNLQVQDYLAVKTILTVGLPLVTYFLSVGAVPEKALLLTAFAGVFAFVVPDLVLKSRVEKRQKAIQKSLPDVLDLLTVSVEAGLGFDSALAKVTEKMRGPLVDEFSRTLQEIRLGKPRRTALRDLADRVRVDELSTFVTALIQADQLGVSIGNVLRVQSEQMRYKRRQKAEETAMKAPVKMLFPMIIFIFPTIFIILLGPAAIRVMKTFSNM
ncbi:MAG: type II secretion system F family protein [Firmicutes bacterium]|nr:type II secretion system F family protein [Bacillota bacterium]